MSALRAFLHQLRYPGVVAKMWMYFVILSLLVAGTQYLLLAKLITLANLELQQRLEWGVAAYVASHLQPLLVDNPDFDAVHRKIAEYSLVNPRSEIYLLNEEGKVLNLLASNQEASPSTSHRPVPLTLIDSALTTTPNRNFPILGPLPSRPTTSTIFSVAPIKIGGQAGFVYVSLQSGMYLMLYKGLETEYFVRGALAISFLVFVGMSVIGYLLLRRLAYRFRRFAVGVQDIAAGKLATRVPVQGSDEIGYLGKAINSMAEKIESSIEQLRANEVWRKETLAAISHDLKGPLASIRGYTEQLSSTLDDSQSEAVQGSLKHLNNNITAMSSQLDAILQLSRLEAAEVTLDICPFQIDELITEELIPRYLPLAKEQSVRFVIGETTEKMLVHADISLIERLLSNVITNAILYNKANGTVRFDFEVSNDKIRTTISDTGLGFSMDKLPELLRPFSRGDASRSRTTSGSGLGMAIVDRIVQAHGGTIAFHSDPGVGTSVSIELWRSLEDARSAVNQQLQQREDHSE